MQIFDWGTLSAAERIAALARPQRRQNRDVVDTVARIFADVEENGADAVKRWAIKLDKREPEALTLDAHTVDAARARIDAGDLAALEVAVENVRAFHEATKPQTQDIEPSPGVRCLKLWRPLNTCGLYAPGGSAVLFSTLVMLAEPARVAGVANRIAVTPPGAGGPQPIMIAAAAACGLDALLLIGGAQAIAALAFGAGVAKADKIFGPGNAYVAEAKRQAAAMPGGPQIDVPAGPSELMVIADARADARVVAADLLSQAEHDADAQVLLACTSPETADRIWREVERQVSELPREAIARAALTHARCFIVRGNDEAAEAANLYGAEHLSLQVEDAEALLGMVENAGAVFVGETSGEVFGDYIAGPSHVLPTDGAARAWGGVQVESFMKSIVVQRMSAAAARRLAPDAARLARLEGLEAHARAADLRAS